jgi:hypothetical protein
MGYTPNLVALFKICLEIFSRENDDNSIGMGDSHG